VPLQDCILESCLEDVNKGCLQEITYFVFTKTKVLPESVKAMTQNRKQQLLGAIHLWRPQGGGQAQVDACGRVERG